MLRASRLVAGGIAALLLAAPALADDLLAGDLIAPKTANYQTAVAERKEFIKTQTGPGKLVYPSATLVQYVGERAKFVKYTIKRNAEVKEGDVLAYLTIDASEAELEELTLKLSRAQSDYQAGKAERLRALSDAESASGAITDPYDREISRLGAAKLRLQYQEYCSDAEWNIDQLTQQLEKAKEKRAMTELKAPFSGVIDDLTFKREDDAVTDGETLISMHSTDVQLVAVENSSQNLRYNMVVTAEYGPAKQRKTLTGRVVACDDVVPSDKRGGYAYVALDNAPTDETLRNISIIGNTYQVGNAIVVPRRAVTLENGKYFVNILADGALKKRYVLFGYNNTNETWVAQGLNEGDTVVID